LLLAKLTEAYKLWHKILENLPRPTRHTLGAKIDNLFTDALELGLATGFAARENKLLLVKKLSAKLDVLKFFLKIIWELKILEDKKYITISSPLAEAGKMIGHWLKLLSSKQGQKQTPPNYFGGE
jgi:hypothetical protein